jgi:hypothetical protein
MQMIDGLAFLLASDERGGEWVVRYSANEMEELFSYEEQKALAQGGMVVRDEHRNAIRVSDRRALVRYVDMVAAARTVR